MTANGKNGKKAEGDRPFPGVQHVVADMGKKRFRCIRCGCEEAVDQPTNMLMVRLHGHRFLRVHRDCVEKRKKAKR